MTVDAGDVLSVFGRSGSGKTTLLMSITKRALGRVDRRIDGEIFFGFRNSSPGRLGVVFDDANWSFCNLRVDEELAFVLENGEVEPVEMQKRVHQTLTEVGLEGFGARQISSLSGGELRKLAVGTALIGRPDVILSDDLDASLDPNAIDDLRNLIESHSKAQGAAWIDFSRRWMGFAIPERPFAAIVDGTLSTFSVSSHQDHVAARTMAGAVGPPLGMSLGNLMASVEPRQTPPGYFDTEGSAFAYLQSTAKKMVSTAKPRSNGDVILAADGLNFSYRGRGHILRECAVRLEAGVVQVLAGKNGVGKTTLARILCGLLRPSVGRITLTGRDASRADLLKAGSLVFQNPEYQFVTDAARREIETALASQGSPIAHAEQVLGELHLLDRAAEHPFNLTLGEKRRLAVGVALALGRKFLIVDEPTLGQDIFQTQVLGHRLRQAADSGVAVLVITHDPDFVTAFGDRILLMEDGNVSSIGGPGDAFSTHRQTLFSGRSHLINFWELAKSAGSASGHVPRTVSDIALSDD
ncbi:ATP-binding cassette domain-containing protein [Bradyrhizobium guangdongense]|uniref:ATP-binding cassette domain-containing protein n=1 Tax=Bradyrhizobium guangdongense TaxID=1325090 RepID=UPI001642EAA0|nr:ABC transporter ATP-binding protein [Bradyrhizobium guangdongense]